MTVGADLQYIPHERHNRRRARRQRGFPAMSSRAETDRVEGLLGALSVAAALWEQTAARSDWRGGDIYSRNQENTQIVPVAS